MMPTLFVPIDYADRPRDFSLIDSSPDPLASLTLPTLTPSPLPPLPLPRSSRLSTGSTASKEFSLTTDGQSARREPSSYNRQNKSLSSAGTSTTTRQQHIAQQVLNRLLQTMNTEASTSCSSPLATCSNSTDVRLYENRSLRNRRRSKYNDTVTLRMDSQQALNSHYEKWTSNENTTHSGTLPSRMSSSSSSSTNGSLRCREIRTICTYIDYDQNGNRKTSTYSMKMISNQLTLRRFKKIMPHPVKHPRFFFRNANNELVELDEEDNSLPVSNGRCLEPIIVAEIISRLN